MYEFPTGRWIAGLPWNQQPIEARLEAGTTICITREGLTPCWLWTGNDNHGYGFVSIDGKSQYLHRWIYIKVHGALDDLDVLHKCDQPRCWNPDHLFSGTKDDNVQNCISKDRRFSTGEAHHLAVRYGVTLEVCRSIIEDFKTMNHNMLAHKYNLTRRVIIRITSGNHWSHKLLEEGTAPTDEHTA